MVGKRFRAFFKVTDGALLKQFALDDLGKPFASANLPIREFFGNSSRQNAVTIAGPGIFDSLRHLRDNIWYSFRPGRTSNVKS